MDQPFPESKRNLTVGINSFAQMIIRLMKVNFLHLSKEKKDDHPKDDH